MTALRKELKCGCVKLLFPTTIRYEKKCKKHTTIETIKMTLTESTSKNKDAEKIVGLRHNGKPSTPLFEPSELGYSCPICGCFDYETLTFSEYRGFLYCYKCNLDIPSCLCVKYYEPRLSDDELSLKDRIIKATRIYLESISQVSKKKNV